MQIVRAESSHTSCKTRVSDWISRDRNYIFLVSRIHHPKHLPIRFRGVVAHRFVCHYEPFSSSNFSCDWQYCMSSPPYGGHRFLWDTSLILRIYLQSRTKVPASQYPR